MASLAPRRRRRAGATTSWSAPVRRGDDRAFELLYQRYQRRIAAYVLGHGQGPRPRGGHHAGGLRLRAAPHARDRAADRLQAVDLRDRQERVHRRLPPRPPRRGGLLRRRRPAARRRPRPPRRRRARAAPPRSTPSRSSTTCCGAFGGLSDAHHEILVMRELEGLSYDDDRRAHGHEPRRASRARCSAPASGWARSTTSSRRARAACACRGSSPTGEGARLGARDERRLARHVAHCQPCRRARARRPASRSRRAAASAGRIAGVAAAAGLPPLRRLGDAAGGRAARAGLGEGGRGRGRAPARGRGRGAGHHRTAAAPTRGPAAAPQQAAAAPRRRRGAARDRRPVRRS